jgi:hypothetical protein
MTTREETTVKTKPRLPPQISRTHRDKVPLLFLLNMSGTKTRTMSNIFNFSFSAKNHRYLDFGSGVQLQFGNTVGSLESTDVYLCKLQILNVRLEAY